ncbi:uncharacterized protein LOC122244358 [Penaeus japonicus]|uniref:uncharacterized protein LOC122244358 n=1 Tax=Penaeus japonicus TaxID=27405 RepID=UPI001C713E65|nr:uncharacterized protein LOC122244358 [Penaeus japonicus]
MLQRDTDSEMPLISGTLTSPFHLRTDRLEKIKANLPDKIKQMLNSGNYSDVDVSQFLADTPANAWHGMKLEQLPTMGKEKMAQLLEAGKDKIPKRVYDQLQELRTAAFTTPTEALNQLKEKFQACKNVMAEMAGAKPMMEGGAEASAGQGNCQENRRNLQILQMSLGKPQMWTKANVTAMNHLVLTFPPKAIQKITNATVLTEIERILQLCTVSRPPAECPPKWVVERMQAVVGRQKYGPPRQWTSANITSMGGIGKVPRRVIPALSASTLTETKADILALNLEGREAWMVTKALAKAEKVMDMTVEDTKTWINGLGSLKAFVTRGDVSAAAAANADIKAILLANAKAKATDLPALAAKQTLMAEWKGKNVASLTEEDVNKIGGALLVQAPPNVVQKLAKNGVLKGQQLQQAAEALYSAEGPGFQGKARELINAMLDANDNNLGSLPESVYPLLDGSQLEGADNTLLEKLLNEAKKKNVQLTADQAAVFPAVFVPGNMLNMPATVKSGVSTKALGDLSTTNLKDFTKGLPSTAPASLMAAKNAWAGKTKITAADVKSNMDVLHLLPPSAAMKVEQADVTAVLEMMAEAPMQPSMTVCRVMKDKLMQVLKNNTGVDEPDEAALILTPTELENTPPCVLAALGPEALDKMSPQQMEMIMSRMVARKNNMCITKATRQLILNRGLGDRSELDGADIEMLGEAALDLSADRIRSLSKSGAEMLVQIANTAFSSGMKPCMTSSERSALAAAVQKAKGPFDQWEDAKDVCCLQQLLEASQFNMIPPDVSSSCTCPPPPPGSENVIDSLESMCAAEIGEGAVEESLEAEAELEEMQVEAGLKVLGDFSTTARRRKRSNGITACDRAAVGGAAVLSVSEIQAMAAADVVACLPDLTQTKMDEDKAKAIIKKVTEARGNLTALQTSDLLQLDWAFMGMMPSEVAELPTLSEELVVSNLGKYWDVEEDTLKAMASKVVTDFMAPESMTGNQLTKVNQLVCGFTEEQVNSIKADAFSSAVVTLAWLEDCPDGVVRALAAKASSTYGDFSTWDAAKMSELGKLVGGLNPEDLKSIPAEAYAGLTPEGMAAIPPEAVGVLEVKQLNNLDTMTAMAITDDQKAKFNDEMKEALEYLLPKSGNGAIETAVMSMTTLVLLVTLNLLA